MGPDTSLATERHYSASEVAELWHVSALTVRRMFEDMPGVLKISHARLLPNRERKPRTTLRIPASILEQVHGSWARGETSRRVRVA